MAGAEVTSWLNSPKEVLRALRTQIPSQQPPLRWCDFRSGNIVVFMLDGLECRGVTEVDRRVRAHPLQCRLRRDLLQYETLLIDREGRLLGDDQVRRAG